MSEQVKRTAYRGFQVEGRTNVEGAWERGRVRSATSRHEREREKTGTAQRFARNKQRGRHREQRIRMGGIAAVDEPKTGIEEKSGPRVGACLSFLLVFRFYRCWQEHILCNSQSHFPSRPCTRESQKSVVLERACCGLLVGRPTSFSGRRISAHIVGVWNTHPLSGWPISTRQSAGAAFRLILAPTINRISSQWALLLQI